MVLNLPRIISGFVQPLTGKCVQCIKFILRFEVMRSYNNFSNEVLQGRYIVHCYECTVLARYNLPRAFSLLIVNIQV